MRGKTFCYDFKQSTKQLPDFEGLTNSGGIGIGSFFPLVNFRNKRILLPRKEKFL